MQVANCTADNYKRFDSKLCRVVRATCALLQRASCEYVAASLDAGNLRYVFVADLQTVCIVAQSCLVLDEEVSLVAPLAVASIVELSGR